MKCSGLLLVAVHDHDPHHVPFHPNYALVVVVVAGGVAGGVAGAGGVAAVVAHDLDSSRVAAVVAALQQPEPNAAL